MSKVMVCPHCGRDVQVIDEKISGHNLTTFGWCEIDGEVSVTD